MTRESAAVSTSAPTTIFSPPDSVISMRPVPSGVAGSANGGDAIVTGKIAGGLFVSAAANCRRQVNRRLALRPCRRATSAADAPSARLSATMRHDPDRSRSPVRRMSDGTFSPIGWDEAFHLVSTRLSALRAQHGADAIYMGNPLVHDHGALLLEANFVREIGTRNSFSAGSQDTTLD